MDRVGNQIPTNSFILPYEKSYGDEAVQLYNLSGNVCQEWQALMLNDIMAINDDGEVFFGTDLGVISFKGFATPGGQTNTEVTVYPNPVRPGFSGYVGIKGLVEDALVRITTVDGSFVTELVADGGQAVWDCTTIDGRKVLPGVYLVFISTKDGNEKYATKILIMN